ncbi:TonB-dependent receptor [Sphingomonas ginkgonis]|uniref:TonB-dependent receptor n=2 Tax=Sphingomonas ginkgonis TaxID=2315330 RepID=A0A429VDP4_9SPHN|nr:TonB-dependent receptor [Sphingomonas ginkgonis]
MGSVATGEYRLAANGRGARLCGGVSVVALCVMAAAQPAAAQSTTTTSTTNSSTNGPGTIKGSAGETQSSAQSEQPNASVSASTAPPTEPAPANVITVTGIRQSLANAQSRKRNSDTVIDSITAQDIGALPDRSVTEALQRVPGVEISRFAGSNDPDHFSVEGSGVTVRGLTFVRSEFNGRDTFSAGVGGQAINFADVPAELLGAVDVYKNATADLIEGGLAGTVNLNTRVPFDKNGLQVGYDLELNYGDLRKKTTPTGSLLLSNTWNTGIGRFGLLGSVSYSRLKSRSDGIQVTNFQTRDGTIVQGANGGGSVCRQPLPSNTDTQGFPTGCGVNGPAGANGFADNLPLAYAPLGGQFRTQDYDRIRRGFAAAAQWESLDRRATLTLQFLRTDSSNKWGEHTFESAPDLSEYNTYPLGCQYNTNGSNGQPRAECPDGKFTNYNYDSNNVFESGYITYPGGGWRGQLGPTSFIPAGGIQQSLSRRQVDERNVVQDHGINLKFNPTDRLSLNFDGDYTKARHDDLDFSVFGSSFADEELDISGKLPVVVPHKPNTLSYSWSQPNPAVVGETDAQYFSDPNVQFWRAAMDHIEHSTGHEYAFRADASYDFKDDIPFVKRVKFGARYADREQTVRYSAYNWGVLSEVWAGTPVSIAQGGTGNTDFFTFPNFFRGATPGPVGGYYYNGDLIGDYANSATYFKSLNNIWRTQNGGAAQGWVPAAERIGVVSGTDYLPSEIQPVSQKDGNAYAMLSFGQNEPLFGRLRIDGNIGIRYVNTRVTSTGSIGAPTQQALGIDLPFTSTDPATGLPNGRCDPRVPVGAPPGTPAQAPGGICLLGPAAYAQLQQFATGATTTDVARNRYHYWLPSFNVKVGISRDVLLRFAASKVLARPDSSNIRNFLTIGSDSSAGFQLTATAGNPYLLPATAWQFDLTGEWYFARVGSLTVDLFAKNVKNFFYSSVTDRPITSNGITQDVFVRGPANYGGTGKIRGLEVAYQQTFDFLPGLLNGLGAGVSYTYIKSKGLPNSFLNGGVPSTTSPNGVPGNLPLEQLSKHNFNLTAFYEKGPISLRAAYNWRSRFLLTSADVIFPYDPIYNEATGQLDASAFLTVNKYVKVGVQGVNLLNEVTRTSQQFTLDGLIGPRSYFVNDRRFSFIVRGSF